MGLKQDIFVIIYYHEIHEINEIHEITGILH